MSSSDLPKLWTEPTKIGHIFRKQSMYFKIIVFKKKYKSWFESTNFAKVVHNFGMSDDDMI